MCGRYQRRSDKQKIAVAFALGNVDGLSLELAPDYNVAPQTMQPIIVWDKDFGTRTLHMMFLAFPASVRHRSERVQAFND
jgi:putative SOS response-associated peptidase YedK